MTLRKCLCVMYTTSHKTNGGLVVLSFVWFKSPHVLALFLASRSIVPFLFVAGFGSGECGCVFALMVCVCVSGCVMMYEINTSRSLVFAKWASMPSRLLCFLLRCTNGFNMNAHHDEHVRHLHMSLLGMRSLTPCVRHVVVVVQSVRVPNPFSTFIYYTTTPRQYALLTRLHEYPF